jgi:hypothetical protein
MMPCVVNFRKRTCSTTCMQRTWQRSLPSFQVSLPRSPGPGSEVGRLDEAADAEFATGGADDCMCG